MSADDPLTQTRIDVAEMKGMLTQALSDQGSRLTNLEKDNANIHGRLSDKSKLLATHSEKISSAERAINELENDNKAKHARIVGTIGVIIAAIGLGVTLIVNFLV